MSLTDRFFDLPAELLSLSMYVPTEELCEAMKRRFLRDPTELYRAVLAALTGADAALRDMQEIYAQAVDEGALINLRLELMAFMQGVTHC